MDWCLPIRNEETVQEYNANRYKKNKEAFQQRHANYYKENKQVVLHQQAGYRKFNVQNKIHHCDVCDKSFGYRKDLNKHYKSLKHSYSWLNSLD